MTITLKTTFPLFSFFKFFYTVQTIITILYMRYLKHNRVKSGILALSTLSVHVKCLLPPPPPKKMNLNLEKFMKKWLNFIKISRLFSRKLKIQVTILENMTQYRDVKILKNQILNLKHKKTKLKKGFVLRLKIRSCWF